MKFKAESSLGYLPMWHQNKKINLDKGYLLLLPNSSPMYAIKESSTLPPNLREDTCYEGRCYVSEEQGCVIDLQAFFLFIGHLPEVAASVFSKIIGRRDTILALPPCRYW